jgi:hypothetical protein
LVCNSIQILEKALFGALFFVLSFRLLFVYLPF